MHILSRDKSELIRKIYDIQKIYPTKGDWYLIISEEKRKYSINLTDEQISNMSKYKFKQLVNKQVNKFAYCSLLTVARGQSKCLKIVENLKTENLQIQPYLTTEYLLKDEQQLLFALRSRSYSIEENFKNQYEGNMICRICLDPSTVESLSHLISCKKLGKEMGGAQLNLEDIYGPLHAQIKFIKIFKRISEKREVIMGLNKSI